MSWREIAEICYIRYNAHNVFMALPRYTSTREGEARQLGVAPNPARVGLAVRKYPPHGENGRSRIFVLGANISERPSPG
jgi:hypothetical protein